MLMIYIMHTNSCVYLLTIIRRDFSVSILIRIFFYMILSFHLFLAESDLPCSAGFSLVVGSNHNFDYMDRCWQSNVSAC